MKNSGNIDVVRFQRASDLGNLEFLHARFVRHSFPRHTHETFAIGVIEDGVQATHYNGSTHIATSGDICLVNPGEVHTGFPPHESGWTYRVFYPEAALLQKAAEDVSARGGRLPHLPAPVIKDPALSTNILHFLKVLEASDISMQKESLLLSVLTQMIGRHADAGAIKPARIQKEVQAVKTAMEYLDAHFAENVTLSDLSQTARLSEFYLLRLFRTTVGLPPHLYLIQKRIDRARALLSKDIPIVQVSLETGFVDQSHFTRWFKKIVGITPGQYRRNSNPIQEDN